MMAVVFSVGLTEDSSSLIHMWSLLPLRLEDGSLIQNDFQSLIYWWSVTQDLTPTDWKNIILNISFAPLKVLSKVLDTLPDFMVPERQEIMPPAQKLPCMNVANSSLSVPPISSGCTISILQSFNWEARNTKAAKNEDAKVHLYLSDEAIVSDRDHQKLKALDMLRSFLLHWRKSTQQKCL